ncbi:outer membrane beta-barrel protein [Pedobacter sp. BG31]|uniref:outer membrane beta-barrel protein n=1 Tax=Pedobacter sp. BG31 TaxID=3349697 RepID=UPI0035F4C583
MDTVKRLLMIITVLGLCIIRNIYAQEPDKKEVVKFKVIDAETQVFINAATVEMHAGNRLIFKGSTDVLGAFTISGNLIPADSVYLNISAVGYFQKKIGLLIKSAPQPVMIRLDKKVQTLKQVEVISNQKLVEDIQGGYKFNTDKMIGSNTGSSLDLLGQVPGIVVDPSGTVMLRGTSAKVFINGKPTNLSGPMLQSLLRSQNGKNIESVVVYTDPPSKFDAAGSGGIIDLVLKKNREKGFSGFASAGAANLPAFDLNTNLTYRNNKFTIYASGSTYYRYGVSENTNNLTYKLLSPDSNRLNQTEEAKQKMYGYYANIGTDFQIDSNQTIGSNIKYIDFNGRFPKSLITDRNYYTRDLTYYTQDNSNRMNNNYLLADINYKIKFPKSKGVLDIDANYANAANRTLVDFTQNYYDAQDPQQLRLLRDQENNTDIRYNFYVLSADYEKKTGKNSNLSFGGKTTFASNINDYVVTSALNGAIPARNNNLSNMLDYQENINSLYFVFSSKINKFSYSLGLRTEHTGYNINSGQIKNDYISFFPNLYAKIRFKHDQQLSLNLSRRIERPSYEILNPFIDNSNPNEISQGNPFLNPSYSNKAQLNYTKYWGDSHSLLVSGYVTYIQDIFGQINKASTIGNIVLNTYENYQKALNYGFYITEESSFGKKVSLSFYFGLRKNSYTGKETLNDENVENPIMTYDSNLQLNYKITKDYSVQLSGDYKSASNYLQVKTKGNGSVNFGFNGRLNKSFTYGFTVQDLFKTARTFTDINNSSFSGIYQNTWRSRYGIIRLNYKFGGGIKSRSRVEVKENDRYKSN